MARMKMEGSHSVTSVAAYFTYSRYCKYKGIKKEDRVRKEEYCELITDLLKEIKKEILEKESGVYLKGLGYFYVIVSRGHKIKRVGKDKKVILFTPKRGGERHRIVFIPEKFDRDFTLWGMDYSFAGPFYKEVEQQIIKGMEYKGLPYTMKNLLGYSQAEVPGIKRKFLREKYVTREPNE